MDRLPQINQLRQKCACCDGDSHISSRCNKVFAVDERKTILKENKLCYNCPGKYHSVAECRKKRSYNNCNQSHHTSVGNKKTESVPTLTSTGENNIIYLDVVVLINGIKCRALLDPGAASSYLSSTIANLLSPHSGRKP